MPVAAPRTARRALERGAAVMRSSRSGRPGGAPRATVLAARRCTSLGMGRHADGDGTAEPLVPDQPDPPLPPGSRRRLPGLPAVGARDADGLRGRAARSRRSCSSASSRGTRRTSRARRSSARPAGSSTARSQAAGIDRRGAYVTNAVKHFKWEARGKRRIHQKPTAGEVRACRPWLEARDPRGAAARARLPRRDRRPGAPRPGVPRHASTAASSSPRRSRPSSWRPSTPPRYSAPLTTRRARTELLRLIEDLAALAQALRAPPPDAARP